MNTDKIISLCKQIEMIVVTICNTGYTLQPGDEEAILNRVKAIMDEVNAPPKSNGDRIRQMTEDEELLSAIGTGCYRCAYSNGECDNGYGEGCITGNLKWLKQEVNTNDDNG